VNDPQVPEAGEYSEVRPPVLRRFRKRAVQYARRPKFLGWAMRNRWHGLIFDPTGRYRCCGHTTPFHYAACPLDRGDQ
jgi:hypothetical protein